MAATQDLTKCQKLLSLSLQLSPLATDQSDKKFLNSFDRLSKEEDFATKKHNVAGTVLRVKFVKAVDGDTIKILRVDRNHPYYNGNSARNRKKCLRYDNVRLFGIDAPELRPSRTKPHREQEKELAKQARDYLQNTIDFICAENNDCTLRLVLMGSDKYGRLLATVFAGQTVSASLHDWSKSFNYCMLQRGLALPYSGARAKWTFDAYASQQPKIASASAANKSRSQKTTQKGTHRRLLKLLTCGCV